MVPKCWCVVSGQVEVSLKSVAPIGIEVLGLLNLVGTLICMFLPKGIMNQQNLYLIPSTVVAFLLQYSGSRIVHCVGFSSRK